MAELRGKKRRPQLHIDNLTRAQPLVTAGRAADRLWSRMRGLIARPPLAPGDGLLIVPCSSVHSHFMGFPIDVVYVDKSLRVVGIDHHLKPWRFGHFYRRVHFVIELPAGTAAATGTQVGDQLQLQGYEL
jgi:hypothetical protein